MAMAFLGFHSHGGTPKKAGLFQGKSLEIALLDGFRENPQKWMIWGYLGYREVALETSIFEDPG